MFVCGSVMVCVGVVTLVCDSHCVWPGLLCLFLMCALLCFLMFVFSLSICVCCIEACILFMLLSFVVCLRVLLLCVCVVFRVAFFVVSFVCGLCFRCLCVYCFVRLC